MHVMCLELVQMHAVAFHMTYPQGTACYVHLIWVTANRLISARVPGE